MLLNNLLNVLTILLFMAWFVGYLLYMTGAGWLIHGLFALGLASMGFRLVLARASATERPPATPRS